MYYVLLELCVLIDNNMYDWFCMYVCTYIYIYIYIIYGALDAHIGFSTQPTHSGLIATLTFHHSRSRSQGNLNHVVTHATLDKLTALR